MTLPSDVGGKTTREVGFFELDSVTLAQWTESQFGAEWTVAPARWTTSRDAYQALLPRPVPSTYAWIPLGDRWTLLLTDAIGGTDVGLLPRRLASEYGVRAVRAVGTDEGQRYPARIVEVYGPGAVDSSGLERMIYAAKDGARWTFGNIGQPFVFEDQSAYRERRVAARFTREHLYDILRNLSIPIDSEPAWGSATVVTRVR